MSAPLALGTFWAGAPLGWLDRLALQAALARGHEVTLFHYGAAEDPGIGGLRRADMRDVWDCPPDLPDTVTPTVFADIFRLHMLRAGQLAWIDTDVLCLRPLVAPTGYLLGREEGGAINNAVLWLPADSGALQMLLERVDDPAHVPEWLNRAQRAEVAAAPPAARRATAARLVPNCFGPKALSWALDRTGEATHALPQEALNPVPWGLGDIYFNPHGGVEGWITEATMAVHLYGSRIRRLHKRVAPYEGSFIARFAREVGFDLGSLPRRR